MIERLEQLAGENARLRLLEQEAGAERAARERAEAEVVKLRAWQQQVQQAGWRERRRLIREK